MSTRSISDHANPSYLYLRITREHKEHSDLLWHFTLTPASSSIIASMSDTGSTTLKLLSHPKVGNGRGVEDAGLKLKQPGPDDVILPVEVIEDALTSKRAYREPWERKAAVDEIKQEAAAGFYELKIVEELEQAMLEV